MAVPDRIFEIFFVSLLFCQNLLWLTLNHIKNKFSVQLCCDISMSTNIFIVSLETKVFTNKLIIKISQIEIIILKMKILKEYIFVTLFACYVAQENYDGENFSNSSYSSDYEVNISVSAYIDEPDNTDAVFRMSHMLIFRFYFSVFFYIFEILYRFF